jgi:hypothetical protein
MTMPCERTRALRVAGEVLGEIVNRADVPEDLRRSATFALRHYPSARLIAHFGRIPALEDWLEPEEGRNSSTVERAGDDGATGS